MKLNEILKNFDENGIFPSDAEMTELIKGTDYDDIYDLEMEMITKAESDVNHPYHPNVTGGTEIGDIFGLLKI